MNQIVLDLETKRAFDEVGGRGHFAELGVSLVGIYLYRQEAFATYEEPELPHLEGVLSETDRVIGFNIRRFDFPVLQPYFKNLTLTQLPILDILEEIEKILGHRVSLDNVAWATLGEGKSGKGLDAIQYYRNGEIEKLKKYCLDDVRITKDVYEFGKKFQKIYCTNREGSRKIEIPVEWQDPKPAANLSLF